MLELQQLQVGYPGRTCIGELSLRVAPGHLVVVLGANGVGKTTLLRTLAGLLPPLSGAIRIADRPIATMSARERAQSLSLALTEDTSAFAGTVRELIQLGRHPYRGRFAGVGADEHAWATRAAEALQIGPWLDSPLRIVSSGMLQRAQLARMWVQQTPLMLLDEPLAHLDWPARYFVMQWLSQMAHRENRTVIMSAHEVGLGLHYADAALVLTGQAGWHYAAPEKLGMDGHLDALYGSQGLQYDALAHDLRPVQYADRELVVAQDDPAALWLGHLAQRCGWRVAPSAMMQLTSCDAGFCLRQSDGRIQHAASWDTLRDLLRCEADRA